MKTDKISFGQTYIRPTILKNMSIHNQQKVLSLIGLGEIYPVDLYLGASKEEELIVDILHSTMGKFLYFTDIITKNIKNTSILQFLDSTERINRKKYDYKLPVYSIKIKNLDKFSIPELQYTLNERIAYYYSNMIDKKFFN